MITCELSHRLEKSELRSMSARRPMRSTGVEAPKQRSCPRKCPGCRGSTFEGPIIHSEDFFFFRDQPKKLQKI